MSCWSGLHMTVSRYEGVLSRETSYKLFLLRLACASGGSLREHLDSTYIAVVRTAGQIVQAKHMIERPVFKQIFNGILVRQLRADYGVTSPSGVSGLVDARRHKLYAITVHDASRMSTQRLVQEVECVSLGICSSSLGWSVKLIFRLSESKATPRCRCI